MSAARHSAVFSLVLATIAAVASPEDAPWAIAVTEENDKFTPQNQDRYYTQGLKVSLNREDGVFFSVAQEINTPADTANPPSVTPPYTDMPYSAALYAGWGVGRILERSGRRDVFLSVEAKLGVIGPSAGGETVQNKFHQLIGTPAAVGWGTQLPDEILVNIDGEIRRRFDLDGAEHDSWDLLARAGLMLGTMRTEALFGAQLRWGDGLAGSWGHSYLRHSTAYAPAGARRPGLAWWLFVDGQVEVIVRNYATDGTNFRDSRAVTRAPIVAQGALGATMQYDDWSLAYFLAARSKDFETQDGFHFYGGLKAQYLF